MRIGISLEAYLTDIGRYKLSTENVGTEISDLHLVENLDLRKSKGKIALRSYLKLLFSKSIENDIKEYIKYLKEQGDNIYIVTRQSSMDNNTRAKLKKFIIEQYLNANNIQYESIVFGGSDNIIDVCERNDIDVYLQNGNMFQLLPKRNKLSHVEKENLINELNKIREELNKKETKSNLTGIPSVDKIYEQHYTMKEKTYKTPKMSMYQYIYAKNVDHLDEVGIKYFENEITYREMFQKIDDCAKSLLISGIGKGTIVTVAMPNTPEAVIIFYALNKIGAIAHMVDPRKSAEELKSKINQVGSTMLFFIDAEPITKTLNSFDLLKDTSIEKTVTVSPKVSMPKVLKTLYTLVKEKKLEHVPLSDNNIDWNDFIERGANYYGKVPNVYEENTGAIIINTGGTTGIPKGAVLTNEYFNGITSRFRATKTFKRQDEALTILPTFHIFGLAAAFHTPIISGGVINLIPKFTPKDAIKILRKNKINCVICVPQLLNFMRNNNKIKKMNLSTLEYVVVGGDTITKESEAEFNQFLETVQSKTTLSKGYGITEGGIAVVSKPDSNVPGSIGIPMVNSEIKFVNPKTYKEVGYGEHGEICLTGSIMLEYYNNQSETDLALKKHKDGKTWLHTGDVGYMDENGIVYFVDRIKRIIISSGENLYPSTIEKVIMEHSAVKMCSVVGAPHNIKGQVPRAHIVLQDGIKATYDIKREIEELCKRNLSAISIPQSYKFRDSMPLTDLTKIDIRKLESEDLTFEIEDSLQQVQYIYKKSKR